MHEVSNYKNKSNKVEYLKIFNGSNKRRGY